MEKSFEKYRGVLPGKVLSRILDKQNLIKADFAKKIGMLPQNFNAYMKGKRRISVMLSLKIDKALNLAAGTFAELQTAYDVKIAKSEMQEYHPNLDVIRPSTFWDADLVKLDFQDQKKGIIKRIMERGNKDEKEEILNFYGENVIKENLSDILVDYCDTNKSGVKNDSYEQFFCYLDKWASMNYPNGDFNYCKNSMKTSSLFANNSPDMYAGRELSEPLIMSLDSTGKLIKADNTSKSLSLCPIVLSNDRLSKADLKHHIDSWDNTLVRKLYVQFGEDFSEEVK